MCSGEGVLPYISHLENRAEHSHQEFPGVPPGLSFVLRFGAK